MRAVVLMLVLAVSPSPSPGGLLGGVVGDLLDILPRRPAVSQPASPAPAPTRAPPAGGKSPAPVAPRSPSSERVVSTVPSPAAPRADAPRAPSPAVNVWVLAAVGLAGLLAGMRRTCCVVCRVDLGIRRAWDRRRSTRYVESTSGYGSKIQGAL